MKTVLIFGHTSGLGYHLSKKYLDTGHTVIGVARRKSDLASDKLINLEADLSSKADTQRVADEIAGQHSKFGALLFCAGTLTSHGIGRLDYAQMEAMYKVNLFAPMIIESKLLDTIKANSADVMNVTSDSAFNFYENYYEYGTSKIALQKFTSDLRKSLKDTPCRVMDFCPSGFQSNIRKTGTGEVVVRDESTYMKAEDLADLIYYLLSLPKWIEIASIFSNRKANI